MKTWAAVAVSLSLTGVGPSGSGSINECWRNEKIAYVHGQEACERLDDKAFIASEHRSDDPLVMAALSVAREVTVGIAADSESRQILGETVFDDFSQRGMRGFASIAVDWSNLLGSNTFRLTFLSAKGELVFLYLDPVSREREWMLPLE